jgi:ABC-type lipoprotein release transport system permease subunit
MASWSLPAALIGVALAGMVAAADERPSNPPGILVSRQLADARGLAVGDVVRLGPDPAGEAARPFRVTAVYEPIPDPFRLTTERLETRFHLPDLIELTVTGDDPAALESVTRVNVALRDPADADRFADDLNAKLPGVRVRPTSGSWSGADPFTVLERFHVAVATVTVIGSAAFLLSLMVMRSEERRQSAGILRLIGVTRPRILQGVFLEGLLISVAGTAFGLAFAVAIEGLFNRFFQWHYDTALVFVHVTPGIAIKCVAIAVPLGILAGVVASWTLLRRNIMALLRR